MIPLPLPYPERPVQLPARSIGMDWWGNVIGPIDNLNQALISSSAR